MSSRSITMPTASSPSSSGTLARTSSPRAGFTVMTFFYTAYSILFLMEMWGDTFPRVFFAWDNLIASLVFVVAGVYFALLGYPAELEEFERSSLGVDLDQLTWREKYFTANKFLIAIWMFIFACGFYYAAGIVWIIYGQPLVGFTFLLSTFAGQAACFIWAYAAMPANMQSNDGAGSSVLYDTCCGCDWPWLKARIGTDALLGNWLFFIACFGAGCGVYSYSSRRQRAWTMFPSRRNEFGVISSPGLRPRDRGRVALLRHPRSALPPSTTGLRPHLTKVACFERPPAAARGGRALHAKPEREVDIKTLSIPSPQFGRAAAAPASSLHDSARPRDCVKTVQKGIYAIKTSPCESCASRPPRCFHDPATEHSHADTFASLVRDVLSSKESKVTPSPSSRPPPPSRRTRGTTSHPPRFG